MKRFLSLVLSLCVATATFSSGLSIAPPKGFDGKVYKGSFALYASSEELGIKDKFICSAQAVAKVNGGYELLSAGHCTPANAALPTDMTFSVAEDLGGPLLPVKLAAAKLDGSSDWSIYYLQTNKKYPVAALGSEAEMTIGDKTVDVNFSLALAKEVSWGYVSSKLQKDGPMAGFFQVTQFDSHGASGSSVVSERTHQVIGIVIAGVDGTTTPTWVEPISLIKAQIAGIDVTQVAPFAPSIKGDALSNHWNF